MSCTSISTGISTGTAGRSWRRHPPTVWLFTDERLGGAHPADPLWRAVAALPAGAGILFRHYGWAPAARRRLCRRLRRIARRRRLCLVVSHLDVAADGIHWRSAEHAARRRPGQLVTAAAHSAHDVQRALRLGADLVFLSPVFPTRSHPGAPTLGPLRFAAIARAAPGPVLALGGMNAARAQRLAGLGAAGHAGIDCWISAGRHGKGALAPARHPL